MVHEDERLGGLLSADPAAEYLRQRERMKAVAK
jgi:hypothetical protein